MSCIACGATLSRTGSRCQSCRIEHVRQRAIAGAEDRFWATVDRRGADECWPWQGVRDHKGYGTFTLLSDRRKAHVVAWEYANGQPFPAGMVGCHACDNPNCVNPAHIFPGTKRDNSQDALRKGRLRLTSGTPLSPDLCSKGLHPWSPENTYTRPNGDRLCRACRDAYNRTQRNARRRVARHRRAAA